MSPATLREFNDGPGFFQWFEGSLKTQDLSGKDVLDLGCGYGGRVAYYFLKGNPRSIVGIEISARMARLARDSVRLICDDRRISFSVGAGEALPFRDESFDLILSYDVFEHVADLPRVLRECHRVLRAGGRLYALFPPYYNPRAHHLGYITTLPFLHHVFSPRVLVDAANQILKEQPEIGKPLLRSLGRTYQGKEVLPGMNGTTERDFYRILAGMPFKTVQVDLLPFAWGPGGLMKALLRAFCRGMLKVRWPFTRDLFTSSIRCVLSK
jgi:SAM-dependent methyltransferase